MSIFASSFVVPSSSSSSSSSESNKLKKNIPREPLTAAEAEALLVASGAHTGIVPKQKITRYRPGQAPTWLQGADERKEYEESDEERDQTIMGRAHYQIKKLVLFIGVANDRIHLSQLIYFGCFVVS